VVRYVISSCMLYFNRVCLLVRNREQIGHQRNRGNSVSAVDIG
jgi:hypothetical protein